jgi:hypothetical protein
MMKKCTVCLSEKTFKFKRQKKVLSFFSFYSFFFGFGVLGFFLWFWGFGSFFFLFSGQSPLGVSYNHAGRRRKERA